MKKKWIIIGALCITIFLGIILFLTLKPKEKENKLIEITTEELFQKLEKKETFILLFSQDGCSHCEEYKPILKRVLNDYNIEAYELDLTKVRKNQEENNKVSSLFNIQGTPTTIFINEGTEKTTINRLIGSSTYSSLVDKLKDRGFIEE